MEEEEEQSQQDLRLLLEQLPPLVMEVEEDGDEQQQQPDHMEEEQQGEEERGEEEEEEEARTIWQTIEPITEESEVSDEENLSPVGWGAAPIFAPLVPPRIHVTPPEPELEPEPPPSQLPSSQGDKQHEQPLPVRRRNALAELATQQATGRRWQRKVHSRRQAAGQQDTVMTWAASFRPSPRTYRTVFSNC